ncbi:MAG: circularly permuted type 2 ATP-grasp protein [Planctomycetota bacterium]
MQSQRQSSAGQQQQQQQASPADATADAGRAAVAATTPPGPLAGYTPPAGAFDECRGDAGVWRPSWAPLRERIDRLGSSELQRRWAKSQRLIQENGVAYSPPRSAEERPRPWRLDPLPIVLPQSDFDRIAAGLEQRARVLDAVLRDLYGPQRLIKEGPLPAELLYRHPSYLLPLRDTAGTRPPALRYYAADIGRSPNGQWWVLADRTEAPSGVGFALENRVVVSRMLPEAFRECRVRRLAPFFAALQESLESQPAGRVRNPRVAILSQGPSSPNHFEDAYLARYLGYTLVEGADLTVRNRRLWLKTLEGLAPIDVVLRRPNSAACDPLEFGGRSPGGVAGLAQAARDGAVSVANPLGSGLVESPVFMAFLPRLAKAVLGEELLLPGVATWWCGEKASLDYVLRNLDTLLIKRAYRRRGEESLLALPGGDAPGNEPTAALADRIRAEPHAYVAQERVERSSAPAWRDGAAAPTRVALRAFAVADGDTYRVMEGALARATQRSTPLEVSHTRGEGSKDVWIVGDEPVEPVSLLPDDDESIELVRFGAELPSRVADNSFWLGRNLERADAKARLVRSVANRLVGERDPRELIELPPLFRVLAEQGQIEPGYAVDGLRDALPQIERSLPAQVLSPGQPGSLAATVDRVLALGAAVRDRLSADAWRVVLQAAEAFASADPASENLTDLINRSDALLLDLAALGGIVVESMTRTQFYRFLDIGRRVERAIQLIDLLAVSLADAGPVPRPLLQALLETADSGMTYRSRYRANLRFAPVLDLLVTDASNPRSLAFQLETLERHVGKLPSDDNDPPAAAGEARLAMSLVHAVRMTDVTAVAEAHEIGDPAPLRTLLGKVGRELPALSDALSLKYLVHAGTPRQLSPM